MPKETFLVEFTGFRSLMRLEKPVDFKFTGSVELDFGECFEVGIKGHLFNCCVLMGVEGPYLKTLVQYGGYGYPAETLGLKITQ